MVIRFPADPSGRPPVIAGCRRTPFGRSDATAGVFREVRGDELAALAVKAAVARSGVDPEAIGEVVLGTTQARGELGGGAARRVALLAGLPLVAGGLTVERGGCSGLEALLLACQAVASGAAEVEVAAGVDHVHHLPTLSGVDLHPRLVARSSAGVLSPGLVADHLATSRGIGRRRQEDYAAESHARAIRALDDGLLADEIVPVDGLDAAGGMAEVSADQSPRRGLKPEAMAALDPLFLPGSGTITAATAAPAADGAAAAVVMAAPAAIRLGATPLARVVAGVRVAVAPADAGMAAALAIRRLLDCLGVAVEAVDLFEIEESSAAVALATIDDLGLDSSRVNVHGGSIAIGDPPAATGLRLVTTLAHALGRHRGGIGVAAAGGSLGQGVAILLAGMDAVVPG